MNAKKSNECPSLKKLIAYSCCLLVGLWLFRLFYSTIRNVLVAQSNAEFVLAGLLLSTTVAVFAFIAIYAWSLFRGLPKVESVCEEEFDLAEIVAKIRVDYLSQMPSDNDHALMTGASVDDEIMTSLKSLRELETADPASFLCAFKAFQKLQDRKAVEVIKRYAKLIAVKTAISPWRLVDMAAVFYNSTLMVCEVAKIYNRRTSRAQAFSLVIGWTFNLYVSGSIGQVAEGAADAINAGIGESLGSEGVMAVMQPVMPVFSKFIGKFAEGGANAYLAYRLGKRSIEAFHFLQPHVDHDLRSSLALASADYLCDKFALNRREVLPELLKAYHAGTRLTGALGDRLLTAEMVVRLAAGHEVRYDLLLYVLSERKVLRATIAVSHEADWAFAPKPFRDKFIRDRVNELKVGIYPAEEFQKGAISDGAYATNET